MSKRTEPLGMIKSHDEIKRIKKAQAMGDKCFSHLLEFITPGMKPLKRRFSVSTEIAAAPPAA